MVMKTAVIYARYSSDSQTEQSIEGQLHVCQDYAQRNGIVILDTYIDRAMTGTNDNRPDFRRMIADSSKKQWNYVLVYKFDRFSRNKYETAMHKHTLKENGVKVLSAMENIPDSPEGIILESVIEGMNQYYSEELSQKVKRGMKETRAKGNYQGGTLPYGYKVIDRKIVVDEDSAEIVRYIYEQYASGIFVPNIIADLTAKGIFYHGKPFLPTTVYGILRNKKYIGIYYYGDELFDNMYPRLLSDELFNKVRAVSAKNQCGRRSIKVDYLLRKKVKCGRCGRPISADTGTARSGEVMHYYKCIGRKKDKNGCTLNPIKKEQLEQTVIDTIVKELNKPEVVRKAVSALTSIQQNYMADDRTLKMLLKEKSAVDKSLQNLVTAVENGIVSNSTNKRLHELEEQQEQLEREIATEQSKQTMVIAEEIIADFYTQALMLEPQMLINYLVKEVVIYDDKIEIYFNSPITSPDESQGFSFCTRTAILGQNEITVCLFV